MFKKINDFSFNSIVVGFLVCLVGYSSSAIIVFEVAKKFGLQIEQASSWLGVLCISMGILSIFFSNRYKIPILFAWSTPGAAIILNSSNETSINSLIGAFLFSAFLIFIFGVTGLFEKLMNRIPSNLAHAMLAGVLFKFAIGIFIPFTSNLMLSVILLFTFLLSKKYSSKYSIVIVMIVGIVLSFYLKLLNFHPVSFKLLNPIFITPNFELSTIVSIGLPLFIVTMTAQNMTGIAVLKSFNYQAPISTILTASGFFNILIAPFGGFALNLAAITAAISMGPDTHITFEKRYTGAIISGLFYILIGMFSTAFGSIFSMFPSIMVSILTGLALFGTITNSIVSMSAHDSIEAVMMTFFVTASGVTLFGIGSAFWGILIGIFCYYFFKSKQVVKV